jgi:putative tryptophan/tyrosine transport system substrate-binding protein
VKRLIGFGLCLTVSTVAAAQDRVAIMKFATHPALNELESSFIASFDSLKMQLHHPIIIEQHNADGNPQTAKELAQIVSRSDVKLIVTIATPAAQAVARTPSKIPILYGAVADPIGAGIIATNRATGIRNAGPSIILSAIQFLRTAFPNAKRLGTLYNPAEQNSIFVQAIIDSIAPKYGFEIVRRTVHDPSEVSDVAQSFAREVDVLFSANDNTVNVSANSLAGVARALKKPFIIGDLSTLNKGAVFAIGLHYGEMGQDLARIAIRLLNGESISRIPPVGPPTPRVWANDKALRAIGVSVPREAERLISRHFQ